MSAPVFEPLRSIDDVDAAQWNALAGTHNPFLRHEFLAALEHSGCVSVATGWQPAFWVLRDAQGLLAALPAYLKSHSWGEFVFDQSWAQFLQRLGQTYYPKLLVAAPFSPASGARLLVRGDHPREQVAPDLALLLQQLVLNNQLSSAHVLFADAVDQQVLRDALAAAAAAAAATASASAPSTSSRYSRCRPS
jgi:predicted N-acyltransferase